MIILGISAFQSDSAAVILRKGGILASAFESRFSGIAHDDSFPLQAIDFCLKEAGVTLANVDNIVFFEKPVLKFERFLETHLSLAPKSYKSFKRDFPVWARQCLFPKRRLTKLLWPLAPTRAIADKILFSDYTLSLSAAAFFPSPYEEAVVLALGGTGEWASSSIALGRGNRLDIHKEIPFPHSLGSLYDSFNAFFEGRLEDMAAMGTPSRTDLILNNLVDVKEDGSFRTDQKYFCLTGQEKVTAQLKELLGAPDADLAASFQNVLEVIAEKIAHALVREYRISNLCLAGPVARNKGVAAKIKASNTFDNIWSLEESPHPEEALGAALAAHYIHHGHGRHIFFDQDFLENKYRSRF